MLRLTFCLLTTVTVLSFAAAPAPAQSQRGTTISPQVHGQVRYAQGGTPAFNVLVLLEKYNGGIAAQETTDRSGRFRFSGLTREQFLVKINIPGFKNVQQLVELNTTLSQYVILTLETDGSGATPATANAGSGGLVDAKVPFKAQEEFTKGRAALLDNGSTEEGIPHLEKAIKIYPSFFEAYLLLGTAYMDTKQMDKAESTLLHAAQINSKKAEPLIALGELYRQQKKYAEAEKTLLAGLKIDDKSWRGHLALGRVYWAMDKIAKAGPHVGTTLRLKPDLAEGHLLGGDILLRARQAENAMVEYEEYLRLEPQGKFAPQTRELVAKIRKALAEKKK